MRCFGREVAQVGPREDPTGVLVGKREMDGVPAHRLQALDGDALETNRETTQRPVASAPSTAAVGPEPRCRERRLCAIPPRESDCCPIAGQRDFDRRRVWVERGLRWDLQEATHDPFHWFHRHWTEEAIARTAISCLVCDSALGRSTPSRRKRFDVDASGLLNAARDPCAPTWMTMPSISPPPLQLEASIHAGRPPGLIKNDQHVWGSLSLGQHDLA